MQACGHPCRPPAGPRFKSGNQTLPKPSFRLHLRRTDPFQSHSTNAAPPTSHTPLTSTAAVHQYLSTRPSLLAHLGPPAHVIEVQELGEGLINHVFKVTCRWHADAAHPQAAHDKSLLLKYAPPYVKSSRLELGQVRMNVEARAMQLAHDCCPEHVPQLLEFDRTGSVMTVQFLGPPLIKVLDGIHEYGQIYPHLPRALASLLAGLYTATCQQALPPDEYRRNVHETFANGQIVTLNEQVVLTDPMDPGCIHNQRPASQELQRAIEEFRADTVVRQALGQVVSSYRGDKEVLLHNDLHFANLLAGSDALFCIDWEFASYGPASFDLGSLLAVQLMAVLTLGYQPNCNGNQAETKLQQSKVPSPATRQQQQEWLLHSIAEFWEIFVPEYNRRLAKATIPNSNNSHVKSAAQVPMQASQPQPDAGMLKTEEMLHGRSRDWAGVYRDAVGFAAFFVFRLTAGIHIYAGYKLLHDERVREECMLRAVGLAGALLHLRAGGGATGPAAVVRVARAHLMT